MRQVWSLDRTNKKNDMNPILIFIACMNLTKICIEHPRYCDASLYQSWGKNHTVHIVYQTRIRLKDIWWWHQDPVMILSFVVRSWSYRPHLPFFQFKNSFQSNIYEFPIENTSSTTFSFKAILAHCYIFWLTFLLKQWIDFN